ncbi:uncharacterized protein CTRU02_207581 [Colletotrichum truncatum]|uniref:Uncharacterized protein n=1 Tax=Colletotrichum truncatum TaxID=5467 RepID=A0ACC3Z182_COLTU|nr:uncharacterized protein CTRU02_00787 [Colletotrichum truncatum]KAF6800382.1 hypothetical protein CTRU02_00787 [Colletotrichum truncatum]
MITVAARATMNVQRFPRPPLLEKTSRHLKIIWYGQVVADTRDAYWVLETHHPPTYYIPPTAIRCFLTPTRRSTYCEWKGTATYYSIGAPQTASVREAQVVKDRIWSYESPSAGFEAIKGYMSFYAGPWDCYVDGELVEPQPGDFYGGWVTSDIKGIIKGAQGNLDPIL